VFKLIVGLGNYGQTYKNTRHNIGCDAVEQIANLYKCELKPNNKFNGLLGDLVLNNCMFKLLIPQTFMNLSGNAVSAVANFYHIPAEQILIIHDELDLNTGVIKIKFSGSSGGHNGLRDITSKLGNNNNFWRVRIGIGHPGHASLVSNYVLSKPSKLEYELLQNAIFRLISHIESLLIDDNLQAVIQNLHSKN